VKVPSSSPAATTFPLPIYHTTTTMSREALRPWNLNVNYLPPPHILSSHPSSPKNVKNKVPSVAWWIITLVQSVPPPNHHRHLQWYSTNLTLKQISLHPLQKRFLQCSTFMIIIAPEMKCTLSQLVWSQLITQPCGIRKPSKIQLKIWQIFLCFEHLTL